DRSVPSMVVLNADGSRPEMCGNGLRCVAGWLADRGIVADDATIVTDAGPRRCEITGARGRYEVRAHMGEARVTGELVHDERRFLLVDVGNPHAVCFEPLTREAMEVLGPAVERRVAGGVNVEFVSRRGPLELDVRVYERGVGWTDACG